MTPDPTVHPAYAVGKIMVARRAALNPKKDTMTTFAEIATRGTLHTTLDQTDPSIIAAGPLTKQPMTVAFRVVLRRKDGDEGFIVHTQYFPHYPKLNESYFDSGDYYRANELHLATGSFGERICRKANTLASVYAESVTAKVKAYQQTGR